MSFVDASEIIFPGTNIRILNGIYLDASTDLPDNDVLFGEPWPAGMDDLGYTKGGIILTLGRTIQDEYFDQDVDPVVQFTTQRDIMIKTVLGQAQPGKIITALGYGDYNKVDPISGVEGYEDVDIAGALPPINDIVPAFEILMPNGQPMRGILYRAQVRASVSLDFKKDTTVNVPFEARAMRDTSGSNDRVLKLRKILAALP